MFKTRETLATKCVEFTCEAGDAQSVILAGDFNQWSMVANPMKRSNDGKWIATLDLAPGRYEYKFKVDGRWCCEPGEPDACCGGPDRVANPHGTMNRVFEVR